jgi:hypothetical protein
VIEVVSRAVAAKKKGMMRMVAPSQGWGKLAREV